MKKNCFVLSVFFVVMFSCKEECKCDFSDLESELEILKEDINKLESVISLHAAYSSQKKIVSVTDKTIDKSGYWVITFSDNTSIQLLKSVVKSWVENKITSAYEIVLADDQAFIFNSKEIIYPTGVVLITPEIRFMKNSEVSIEFRVNPSNAIFNYDVHSEDCQIALDMAGKLVTYSYVTPPEGCRMVRIEQSVDVKGNVKEGQYKAYIRDNGRTEAYKYATALVLSTLDKNGDLVQLSSPAIPLERKKDTGLPVVVIRTENGMEIKDKENWIPGNMTIHGTGKFDDYEGEISVRGRGNFTWWQLKKPYAIKLDKKEPILGMPAHKRWVLLANYLDRTLMRNYIAFEVARRTSLDWTPSGQFVEVMLNDVHLGNYFLCEHIKVDENRVNITEMTSSDLDEEAITGGYLLEMDEYYDEVNKFRSAICNMPVMFKDPDEETLQPEQFEYVRTYIDLLEELLYADDFASTRSYVSMIDEISFADWWIVNELTCNFDVSYPRSSYFNKDRLGVLKAGPVWDFDWMTFTKQTDFCCKNTIWYGQLFKDPAFVDKVKGRWQILKPEFEEVIPLIEGCRNRLSVSEELNTMLWGDISNLETSNGDENLSHREACLLMRNNYQDRIKWLDGQIRNF